MLRPFDVDLGSFDPAGIGTLLAGQLRDPRPEPTTAGNQS
jgi:hypothetical protein